MEKKDKIKFVRYYKDWGNKDCYDVVYYSRRLKIYIGQPIPKTVRDFMAARTPRKQYDKLIDCTEYIYD